MAKQSTTADALVSPQRKKEVLGLILMVLSALIALALVTYSPADAGLASAFSVERALETPAGNRVDNALGLVGAGLSMLLIPNFLGYPSLFFTALLFAWGYVFFRNRSSIFLPLFSLLTAVGAFVIACLFGWFGQMLNADLTRWSGDLGRGTAAWMQHVFGSAGSLILLFLALAVTILVAVDRDIQRSLDRLATLFKTLKASLLAWWSRQREALARRRQKRRERRKTYRKKRNAEKSGSSTAQRNSASSHSQAVPSSPSPAGGTHQTVNDLYRSQPTSKASAPSPAESKKEQAPPPTPSPPKQAAREPQLKVQKQVEEEKAAPKKRAAKAPPEGMSYKFPALDLLDQNEAKEAGVSREELEQNKRILLDKLETYNIEITEVNAVVGPTVTRYELTPAAGVKISRITSLENDLAMALAASGIRTIAPIPGKTAVGVEVPNNQRELVRLHDVLGTARFRDADMELPIAMGKSIEGEVNILDLSKMPHLLIAGATGSGKSVGINALITSLLYACHPANLKFVMIDPKKIELQQYVQMADHYIAMPEDADDPIITDVQQALGVLKSCEREMEARYDLLSDAGVRGIQSYNQKVRQGNLSSEEEHRHLPYLVVVVDELADLMMTAGKEIEGPIARLAQMARAVGIHLVLATQRPSVDVITGLIKANFPARMAYQVASRVDSRTILDQGGAEDLVGNGDLLYQAGSHLTRLQGPFVSIDEVNRLTRFIGDQRGSGPYLLPPIDEDSGDLDSVLAVNDRDELFEQAAHVIVRRQQGSVSLLQRKLSVGYTRAARIVDQLEDAGIVGPFVGSKARDVLVEDEDELERLLEADAEEE